MMYYMGMAYIGVASLILYFVIAFALIVSWLKTMREGENG